MVIDGLDGRTGEEPHGLPDSHTRYEVCKTSTKGVKEEAFKWVIVQSSIRVRHIQSVVTRVECD